MFAAGGARQVAVTPGDRVRELREAKHWSQRKLAMRAGINHSIVSTLESGERPRPSGETLEKIAAALGTTVDYLLTGRRPEPEAGEVIPFPSRLVGPVVLVPVVEFRLSAGRTVFGETLESVPVPSHLAVGRRLVAARIEGDCLEPEVRSGDIAVIDANEKSPRENDLVAILDRDEGTMLVKRYVRMDGRFGLVDAKGNVYSPRQGAIQGVVVFVGRSYR